MKRSFAVAALAALALVGVTGSAHAQKPVQFGVGGGLTIPTSDVADGFKTGFNGMALLRFAPPAFPVKIQVDGMFHRLGADADGVDIDLQVLNATADLVWEFPSAPATPVRPYLIGGIGIYNTDLKGNDVPVDVESSTDFGFNVGAGFDFKLGGATLFAEARFHTIMTEGNNAKVIPITVGFRF